MVKFSKRAPRSACPIATSLEIIGDRWTLIILRDMICGKSKFSEFLNSPERITTNILTDRLALIEEAGLAEKKAYQERPPRYEYRLTEKGEGLLPVMQEISKWANKHMPETWVPPESFTKKKVEN